MWLSEPDLYRGPKFTTLSGKRIAEDYSILHLLLAKYPQLKDSILVGPDVAGCCKGIFTEYVVFVAIKREKIH